MRSTTGCWDGLDGMTCRVYPSSPTAWMHPDEPDSRREADHRTQSAIPDNGVQIVDRRDVGPTSTRPARASRAAQDRKGRTPWREPPGGEVCRPPWPLSYPPPHSLPPPPSSSDSPRRPPRSPPP